MIRIARPEDAAHIQAIYAPVVRDTVISFEMEPPTVEAVAGRIRHTLEGGLPWIVLEQNNVVQGYVYAGRHRGDRPAYGWSVEVSVYVSAEMRGSGVGRALYTSLFAVLAIQNFQNAFAGATLPNAASVALHESFGFERIGIFEKVGFKNGSWHDVIWWQKMLNTHDVPPEPVIRLDDATRHPAWTDALHAGEAMLTT